MSSELKKGKHLVKFPITLIGKEGYIFTTLDGLYFMITTKAKICLFEWELDWLFTSVQEDPMLTSESAVMLAVV